MKYIILSILISILFAYNYNKTAINLFYSGKTRGDLTNFAQAMYNSSKGRYMENTFNYSIHNFWGGRDLLIPKNSSIFGIHFNPILTLFIPIYVFFPDPVTLISIQTYLLCISSTILFLYLFDKKLVFQAFVGQLLFLTHTALQSAIYSEFHAYALGVFFISIFLYYSEKNGKGTITTILFVLSLLVQENISLPLFAYCFLKGIVNKKNRLYYLSLGVISVTYFIFVTKYIIPQLSNYKTYIFESIYGNPLGQSFIDIIKKSLSNPLLLIKTLITKENITYIWSLTKTGLPYIFSPVTYLPAIVSVMSSLISSSTNLRSETMHYESIFVPFLYFSWSNSIVKLNTKMHLITIGLIIITIYTLISNQRTINFRLGSKLTETVSIMSEITILKEFIRTDESLSTQDYLSGYFTNRQELYLFPVYASKSKYVLLSKQDTWPLKKNEQDNEIELLKTTHNITYDSKNYLLLTKK